MEKAARIWFQNRTSVRSRSDDSGESWPNVNRPICGPEMRRLRTFVVYGQFQPGHNILSYKPELG
jgi:hypothetical protein